MPNQTIGYLQEYIAELKRRASASQAEAQRELNPLFARSEGQRAPSNFVESSFLYMRACDADIGSRPVPCPVFWLSPDLRVAPLTNLGMPTRELIAGATYRFTATVRNRGDLPVPSAKVEFYLANPTLGFDTRFATRLGVNDGRVQAHGSTEVPLEYTIPPALAGHRCLVGRVFSFSPLDLPASEFGLDPLVDRHVVQLNLNIVAQESTLRVDWIHLPNAAERLELVPMMARTLRELRNEAVTALTLVSGTRLREVHGQVGFDLLPAETPKVESRRTDAGVELLSHEPNAVPVEEQSALTKQMLSALRSLESGRADAKRYTELFQRYRAMVAQSVRSQVTLALPDVGLKPGQALPVHLIRRNLVTGKPTGGIGLLIAGEQR